MSVHIESPPAELAPRPLGGNAARIGRAAVRRAPGPGVAAIYLSLIVLVPLGTLFSNAFTGGFSTMWAEITNRQTVASIRLVLLCSLAVVVVNTVLGTVVAWQLVRDRFVLNRLISAVVDLPFALPTIVAGVTLLSLYGPGSPFHLNAAFSRWSILLALSFVTLPFSVRSVQPVLAALDRETEEAAASLGASTLTTFRRITLPSLAPALLTGAGLAFARALGEYGSISLISGNVPFKTEVASVRIYGLIESNNLPAAAATSLALSVITILVLTVFSFLRRRFVLKEASG
ncbi:MAG TPA: ABC transporter permease subunit [Acidimicrobiales bacterium]|jgi:sulfate transport system permease protein